MKPLLFVLLSFVVLFTAGCSKEYSEQNKEDNGFFVRFSLDGTSQNYRENVVAERNMMGTEENVVIQGLSDLTTSGSALALVVAGTPAVTPQTYSEMPGQETPAMVYRDSTGIEYSNIFMTGPSGLEIVVNEIDVSTIRGTFKGQVSDVNGNIVTITDGAFYAPF